MNQLFINRSLMHGIVTLVVLMLLLPLNGAAQSTWKKIDSLTYRLYLEKKWEPLLEEVADSLNQGIDFYYLRVRAGVAAYKLKKYRTAVEHFRQARSLDDNDEFVNKYYYYALIMLGQNDEASFLADRFPPDFISLAGIRTKGRLSAVTVEAQLGINSRHADMIAQNIIREDGLTSYRSVLKTQLYESVGLEHHITGRLNVFHSFSQAGVIRTQQYQSAYNQLKLLKETSALQYQYRLHGRFLAGRGWVVRSAVSSLWGRSNYHLLSYNLSGEPVLSLKSWTIADKLINAGISKELPFLRPKVSVTYGEINRHGQLQADGQLVIYPLENADLYFISDVSLHFDESVEKAKSVFAQKLGVKGGPAWFIADGTWGMVGNFSSSEGLVVYNMPEVIKNIHGITVYLPMFNYRLDLTARVSISRKKAQTYVYTTATTFYTRSYSFTDQGFLISLKWYL